MAQIIAVTHSAHRETRTIVRIRIRRIVPVHVRLRIVAIPVRVRDIAVGRSREDASLFLSAVATALERIGMPVSSEPVFPFRYVFPIREGICVPYSADTPV